MKNKKLILIINIFIFLFFSKFVSSEEFNFKSSEIIFLDNGNKIEGINGVDLTTDGGLRITGKKFEYNKINSVLNVKGDVVVYDNINQLILKSNEIIYLKKQEIIYTKAKTVIEYINEYFFESSDLTFNRNEKIISSKEKINIKDLNDNKTSMSNFNLSLKTKILKGNDIQYTDSHSNKIFVKKGMINLTTKELAGKDSIVEFENSTFGISKNEPRLKANSIYSNQKTSKLIKATFTTCKKTDSCPPWTLSASEVSHDKDRRIINYKNSWLKLYDYPIFYFPKFYHPDPTVKRQSGFLTPVLNESNLIGSSISIPYFNVISESKDMTFTPILFSNESALIQTEYRVREKKINHDLDLSYFASTEDSSKTNSKSHFFSNSSIGLDIDAFDTSTLNVNLQKTTHDTYLKTYKLKSPLIKDQSLLHSSIDFNGSTETSNFNLSAEVYEDLTKSKTDRYEYILPNFEFIKSIYPDKFDFGYFSFKSSGYKKQSNTNINEATLINNLYLNSNSIITKKGFKNKFVGLFKNVNKDIENSSNTNVNEMKILSAVIYEMSFPLRKQLKNHDNIFTPILSLRYSPNKTRNIRHAKKRIDINNIYSIDRIGENDSVEGGQSITLGSSFKKINKLDKENLTFDFATTIRDTKNNDMPLSTTMGDKQSDFVGKATYSPNNIFNLSYDFSYDNNLKYSNYDSLATEFSVNNFVTKFQFLEENNLIGNESYFANKSTMKLGDDKSLSFSTRRNRKTDLTEYYNLIYEYKNDCLIASIQYNKDYYTDGDLKPEEQLFFTITIVPFSSANTPNINK